MLSLSLTSLMYNAVETAAFPGGWMRPKWIPLTPDYDSRYELTKRLAFVLH